MQKLKQLIQRGISPVWAIVIIVAVAVIVATAVLVHGYFWTPAFEAQPSVNGEISNQDEKEMIINELLQREGIKDLTTKEQLENMSLEDLKIMQESGYQYDLRERNAKRILDISMIRTAISMYQQDHGDNYPSAIYGSDFFEKYLDNKELRDPLTNEPYFYYLCLDGKHYHIGALLEEEDWSDRQYLKNDSDAEKCGPEDFSGEDPIYDIYW